MDSSFSPFVNDSVYAVAVQPDGKILIGGAFTTVGATSLPYVARLNTNGTVDTTFVIGNGAGALVTSIALQPDGKILLGGKFTAFNGTGLNYLARLTPTGGVDPNFTPGTGPSGVVYSIAVHPTTGRITLGGDFATFNGFSRNRFARLGPDGVLDATFSIGTGANAPVRSVALQPDSAVFIGGEFTLLEDLPRSYIARIHGEEKLDLTSVSFNVATYSVSENATNATITVVRSGNTNRPFAISFTTSNGTAVASIDYRSTNGQLSFASGDMIKTFTVPIIDNTRIDGNRSFYLFLTNPPVNVVLGAYPVAQVTILDDETGIQFASTNYTVLENATNAEIGLVRLGLASGSVAVTFSTSDGTAAAGFHYVGVTNDVTFADGETNKTVLVPIIDDGIKEGPLSVNLALSNPVGILLGTSNATLIIIDTDPGPGGVDPRFDPGDGANEFVRSLALQLDGKVLVAGGFTIFANTNRNYIARLNTNGTHDLSFDPGLGADALVASVACLPDGKIMLGGSFTNLNGLPYNRLGKLLPSGLPDAGFSQGAGFNAAVNAISLQENGRTLAAGGFTLPVEGLIQVQPGGSVDHSFDPGLGSDGPVHCVLANGGQVLIGGAFSAFNGFPRSRVARLNADGGVDLGFIPAAITNGSVYCLDVQPDGRVLIGGDFFTTAGTNRVGLARLNPDGSLDSTFDVGPGANAPVFALAVQDTGKIIAAGSFTSINNTNWNRFARLRANGSLDLGFDPGTGANSTVYAVALLPDGNFLIGGDFTVVNGLPRSRIAKIKSDDKDPQFISILAAPGLPAQISLTTVAGRAYVLEASPNLLNWSPVLTNTATGPTLTLTDPNPNTGTNRFYRARQL